jgi:DNA-binding MarR family transcriptional regulator
MQFCAWQTTSQDLCVCEVISARGTMQQSILSLAHRAHFAISARYRRALGDLTDARFRVLEALMVDEVPVSQSVLLGYGFDTSTISAMLPTMERDGLIRIVRDMQDRRRRIVSLTPDGRKAYKKAAKAIEKVEQSIPGIILRQWRTDLESIIQLEV